MLDLREKDWNTVKNILSQYPYQFYAFGSRANKTARRFSDLDLCYKEKIPDNIISRILGEFEESDLPFKVELVSWDNCSEEFQRKIEKDLILLERRVD